MIFNYRFRYHIPRSFLKPTGNLLVLLEEENGYPPGISIDTVSVTKICGHVSDSHPPPVISWRSQNQRTLKNHKKISGRRPKVQLRCPPGRKISKILFASYGNPSGNCDNYAIGSCDSSNSRAIVEKVRFLPFNFYFLIFFYAYCLHVLNYDLRLDQAV